jgi:polar amino acid transport system permease protein
MNNFLLLLKGALATMQIAGASMIIGMSAGLILGTMSCSVIRIGRPAISIFVWAVRGTPLFVQVLFLYYGLEWVGLSLSPMFAGITALGINSAAYLTEIVRGSIDAIPLGQWQAAQVLGCSRLTTLKGIIVPQALKLSIPAMTNELTALIKETSILMVIGVYELTKVSKDIVTREFEPMSIFLLTSLLYLALTSGVTLLAQGLSKWLSRRAGGVA